MSQYSIQINGKTYGLISRYAVPSWLATEYCTMPFILNFGSESISRDKPVICFLCNRRFEEATRKCPLLCENMDINHRLGVVGVCCSDCNYFLKMREGYKAVPISIKKTLDAGFYPVNLGKYITL
jgi:hypothetical protein